MEKFIARHGDVLIMQVDKLPDNLEIVKPIMGQNILAWGETTGHGHAVKSSDSIFYFANDNLIELGKNNGLSESRNIIGGLRVIVDNTKLWHGTPKKDSSEPSDPDHDTINLPAGDYIVCLPREYSDEDTFVRVAD